MNFYNQNPFQMMMNSQKNNNPIQQLMSMGANNSPQNFNNQNFTQIDRDRLRQGFSQFDENKIYQLVQQARNNGISDEYIEQGLNFLLNMK